MLPNIQEDMREDFTFLSSPGRTFQIHPDTRTIGGTVDQIRAVAQTVFLILNAERYEWLIYSWNYGVELKDLIGQPMDLCIPEMERRIREALLQDDRITGVENFIFERRKNKVHATFTVVTIYGPLAAEKEVET